MFELLERILERDNRRVDSQTVDMLRVSRGSQVSYSCNLQSNLVMIYLGFIKKNEKFIPSIESSEDDLSGLAKFRCSILLLH